MFYQVNRRGRLNPIKVEPAKALELRALLQVEGKDLIEISAIGKKGYRLDRLASKIIQRVRRRASLSKSEFISRLNSDILNLFENSTNEDVIAFKSYIRLSDDIQRGDTVVIKALTRLKDLSYLTQDEFDDLIGTLPAPEELTIEDTMEVTQELP